MRIKNRKIEFQPVKKINNNTFIIMWDYQPILSINSKGEEIETPLAIWQEKTFLYKPTLNEVKSLILEFYNEQITNKILSGFEWNNMKVWLSHENQINYKTIYDLAIQTDGQNLPVVLKFGSDENTQYFTFNTIKELSDFYLSSVKHIQKTLRDGWKQKDELNWTVYSEKLK